MKADRGDSLFMTLWRQRIWSGPESRIKFVTSYVNGKTWFHLMYDAIVPLSENLCIIAQIAWLDCGRRRKGSILLLGFSVYLLQNEFFFKNVLYEWTYMNILPLLTYFELLWIQLINLLFSIFLVKSSSVVISSHYSFSSSYQPLCCCQSACYGIKIYFSLGTSASRSSYFLWPCLTSSLSLYFLDICK